MSRTSLFFGFLISMSFLVMVIGETQVSFKMACAGGVIASLGLANDLDKVSAAWWERLIFLAVFAGMGIGVGGLYKGI